MIEHLLLMITTDTDEGDYLSVAIMTTLVIEIIDDPAPGDRWAVEKVTEEIGRLTGR